MRKSRPRTTCLYSAASTVPRNLSAAAQRVSSNPIPVSFASGFATIIPPRFLGPLQEARSIACFSFRPAVIQLERGENKTDGQIRHNSLSRLAHSRSGVVKKERARERQNMTKAEVARRPISVALEPQGHISCFTDFFSEKWKTGRDRVLEKKWLFFNRLISH